ncbi:MAG TPA: energy transducer TonB [Candidatus Acidoferrales bacterium]|nr:energy transducer TonB [Candidatus Acidoferrales bacterium]
MRRDMSDNRALVLTFAWLVAASLSWAAQKKGTIDPQSLILKARSKEILWTEGTPKTAVRADLQVAGRQGGWVTGQYVFAWASPSRWREEIKFANYDRLWIGGEKGYWQTSNLDYQPEIVFQLDKMLDIRDLIGLSPDESLGKVKQRKKHGVTEDCTEVKGKFGTARTLCFDDAAGALVAVEYATPGISLIEYSDFRPVAGKILPFEIRATNDGRAIAVVKVTTAGGFDENDGALFSAPTNAEFWARCDDMRISKWPLQSQAIPVYPSAAKANHEQGTVIFYAIIEADGSVSHLAPIQMAAPDLVASAADAVRTWRYTPAMCDGKPIRRETQISVVFTLGGP